MFEFHGWASLRSTAGTRDDAWQDREDKLAVSAVSALVRDAEHIASGVGGQIAVQQVNGGWQLWIHGLRNHRRDEVVALYERIAAVAPGSYGLLHIHDDEAEDDDRWVCFTMLRGQVKASTEFRLSPHFGRVEDIAP